MFVQNCVFLYVYLYESQQAIYTVPKTCMGGTGLKFESWKVQNHVQINIICIAFWQKSESWNLAVARKVPPMYTFLATHQHEFKGSTDRFKNVNFI